MDENESNYLVMYLRFVIGGFLKQHAVDYEPFLLDYFNMSEFVSREVEIIDKEADSL